MTSLLLLTMVSSPACDMDEELAFRGWKETLAETSEMLKLRTWTVEEVETLANGLSSFDDDLHQVLGPRYQTLVGSLFAPM